MADNVVVKIPMTEVGIFVVNILTKEGTKKSNISMYGFPKINGI